MATDKDFVVKNGLQVGKNAKRRRKWTGKTERVALCRWTEKMHWIYKKVSRWRSDQPKASWAEWILKNHKCPQTNKEKIGEKRVKKVKHSENEQKAPQLSQQRQPPHQSDYLVDLNPKWCQKAIRANEYWTDEKWGQFV